MEEEELHTKQVFLRSRHLSRVRTRERETDVARLGLLLEDRMVTEAQMVEREDFLEG